MSGPVVVTGGSRGIGRAIVEAFAADGCDVVAVGRDRDALARLAAEHRRVTPRVCDVTDERDVSGLASVAADAAVLVNCAGVSDSAPVTGTSLEQWHRQMDVNALGPFLCTRALLPGMLERGAGRVVTVASSAGVHGARYTAAYTASKHAAVGLMRVVASEVAGTGVTANAVCPSFVRTDMTRASIARIAERTGRSPEDAAAALAAASPLGRLLEPQEVAAAVRYLASAEAAGINGQTLVLDGGGVQT